MDVTAWILVAIAAVGCLLTSVTLVVKVTRLVTSIDLTINTKVSEAKKEFYLQNDKLRKEVAETVIPLKTLVGNYEAKHFELELYIRDNYIEVSTFKEVMNDIKNSISDLSKKIDQMSRDSVNWRKGKTVES